MLTGSKNCILSPATFFNFMNLRNKSAFLQHPGTVPECKMYSNNYEIILM